MSKFIMFLFFGVLLQSIFLIFYSKIAHKIGLIDIPDSRKRHIGNIPLVGGLSIYSCFFFFFLVINTTLLHKIIFLSSSLVFIVGLYDDKFKLGVSERFFFQMLACLIVIGFGIRIYDIGDYLNITVQLGGFGLLLSLITIIAYTNAINFSDGLDGLASGLILNCLMSIILFSFLNNNFTDLEPLIFLLFMIIIFLFANHGLFFNKVFLGDSGSTALGFLVSCYLVYFTLPDHRFFHPVLTLWAAPLPIFDLLNVFFLRLLNGKNPFRPDRMHLHFLLLNTNISKKIIPFFMISLSMILSLLGYMLFILLGSIHSIVFFIFLLFIFVLFSLYLNRINQN